jgi:hypothetical protein
MVHVVGSKALLFMNISKFGIRALDTLGSRSNGLAGGVKGQCAESLSYLHLPSITTFCRAFDSKGTLQFGSRVHHN